MKTEMRNSSIISNRCQSGLSGGEAQRLKIAREIIQSQMSNTLYLFDEPSRGLHPTDIQYIINLFELLLQAGNTVIAIEHNPLLIAGANHVVDLGPGGGEAGGRLIFEGKPEKLVLESSSQTGKYMSKLYKAGK